jgi:DNA-binding TFAR19-related protein (PDSD5 family)
MINENNILRNYKNWRASSWAIAVEQYIAWIIRRKNELQKEKNAQDKNAETYEAEESWMEQCDAMRIEAIEDILERKSKSRLVTNNIN